MHSLEVDEERETEEMKMLQFLNDGEVMIKHGRNGQPKPKRIYVTKVCNRSRGDLTDSYFNSP